MQIITEIYQRLHFWFSHIWKTNYWVYFHPTTNGENLYFTSTLEASSLRAAITIIEVFLFHAQFDTPLFWQRWSPSFNSSRFRRKYVFTTSVLYNSTAALPQSSCSSSVFTWQTTALFSAALYMCRSNLHSSTFNNNKLLRRISRQSMLQESPTMNLHAALNFQTLKNNRLHNGDLQRATHDGNG